MTIRDQVRLLAMELPDLLPGLEVAVEVANEHEGWQRFAGAEVNGRLLASGLRPFPNLRVLAGYGLIVKVGETTRGGKRAYWWMPDRAGVEHALEELASPSGFRWGSSAVAYEHGFRASHSPFPPTTPAGRTEWHVYRESDNSLLATGFAADVPAARDACVAAIQAQLAKQ
jgi:hypothetical protein